MERATSGGNNDVRRQAQSTAATVADQAQKTAEVQLSGQKDQAAETLHTVAESIRDGGKRMRQEQPQIASLANQAADKVDEASTYIRDHEVRDFVGEVESFARREPLIFLGGAFAVGFLAARFLKASSPQRERRSSMGRRRDEWYAVGHDGGRGADPFARRNTAATQRTTGTQRTGTEPIGADERSPQALSRR